MQTETFIKVQLGWKFPKWNSPQEKFVYNVDFDFGSMFSVVAKMAFKYKYQMKYA